MILWIICLSPFVVRCEAQDEFSRIAAWLELGKGDQVADVGAGGGTWTRMLAEHVGPSGKVYGTDVKEQFLEGVRILSRRKNYQQVVPILGTETDTGLTPNSCDAILLRLVYHAFDDARAMRASLFSALKPGGRILVIGFRPDLAQLTKEMAASGFTAGRQEQRWCGQEGVYARVFRKPKS